MRSRASGTWIESPWSICQPISSLLRARVSSSDEKRSSMKRGLPSAPRLTASTMSSGVPAPRRELTSWRSAS